MNVALVAVALFLAASFAWAVIALIEDWIDE